jgi:DNA-binding GntR family transcriptional regulator
MKSETVFKRAYNDCLDCLVDLGHGARVPSENTLGELLGVSRTTVRKVLDLMQERGVLAGSGRARKVDLSTHPADRFPEAETVSMTSQVEAQFMQWMLKDDARPGSAINELELSREFGVATTSLREFLNRFQRFGLIQKRPNSGWIWKGFTRPYALELFEIREMFEVKSSRSFAALPPSAPAWAHLRKLRDSHIELLDDIDVRFHDFSELDSKLHRLINSATPNRFIDSFYDIITLIFHYHYQWNKRDERQRNERAIHEHLAYIDALLQRDVDAAERACRTHLASARNTLLQSIVD